MITTPILSSTNDRPPIILTDEQQEGVNQLLNWVRQEHSTFAVLKGSAGCGKTTVLKNFLEQYKKRVVVSAPTHKAKTVIGYITGRTSATLQSLLGLRPDCSLAEYDIDNPVFRVLGNSSIGEYDLVVIDEASMINEELYSLIQTMALDNKVRVLFVGDELQLPPVNEEKASALMEEDKDLVVTLKTVIRQSNSNPVNEIFFLLREDIQNQTHNTFSYLRSLLTANPQGFKNINENNEGFVVLPYNEQQGEFIAEFFKNPPHYNYVRYISWTNENVSKMNRFIRSKIYNEPFIVMENELLMSYKTISQQVRMGKKVTYEELLFNSEDYVVENSSPAQYEGIVGIECMIRSVNSNTRRKIFIVQPSSFPIFLQKHNELYNDAITATDSYKRKIGWQSYYTFKNYFLILGNILIDKKDGKKHKAIPKDLDYAYGITVHKSQGSTYENVIVNVADISNCRDVTDRNKLLYVAASRVSKVVYFLI